MGLLKTKVLNHKSECEDGCELLKLTKPVAGNGEKSTGAPCLVYKVTI